MTMSFGYEAIGAWLIVTCDWTSDPGGLASGTTLRIVGELVKGTTVPGSPQPADLYDITLLDAADVNVLALSEADLSSRSDTDSQVVYFCLENSTGGILDRVPAIADALAVRVAGAGSETQGQLVLLVRGQLAGTR